MGRSRPTPGRPTAPWYSTVYFLGSLITVTLNGTLVSTVEGADDVKSKVHDVGTPYVCGIGRVTGRVRGGGRGGVTPWGKKWSRSAMQGTSVGCVYFLLHSSEAGGPYCTGVGS